MHTKYISSKSAWHALLRQLPNPHALQSWDWGEFKQRWGWNPFRLAFFADDVPVAVAQILRRQIPRTPWSMVYVPKGPIFRQDDLSVAAEILAQLETVARERRALFMKIDPDVPLAFGVGETKAPNADGIAIRTLMEKRGWRYSPQQIQFKNTVLLNVAAEDKTLLARMKSKTRYNIRLAGRKGVTIRRGTVDDLNAFYDLYAITSARDNFFIRPREYYLDVWQSFLDDSQAELLLAEFENTVIAGVLLFYFGDTAWYMYGASDNTFRNVMPNYLLQWHAMQTARAHGCETYDLWGAPDIFDESDGMWGVYRFKTGFGGITRHGLGAYDFPVHPMLYRTYMELLPRGLKLVRQLRGG